ncbi:putative oxidoreductase [Trypanosoma conorhini]|uniref:Putative oxidoreductase n=1 Tax=Trypanosoma conorhini TaxID=83891 RepID=A0A3R7NWL4_9TRYP|nr:putative oxidoreductase [Trypanosoma conorhini]RNF24884.1 putative oxidoreductase [Trypanosoma conorhini]
MSAQGQRQRRVFDVLVLGAGAAGCAAARAIALRHPHAKVGLVEQGTRRPLPLLMRVPLLTPLIASARSTQPFLRKYEGTPEAGIGGRRLTHVRGCGLGGSSCCGDMRYLRGTAADYAAWGDPAWSFAQLLPFFRALECNSRGGSAAHGEDGPLHVTDAPRASLSSELNIRWFEACEALGLRETPDLNAGEADGFAALQSLVAAGARVDVFDALLERHRHLLPNLTVLPETRAQRVLFDGARVTGVETRTAGRDAAVLATRHLVVCLGALESPALLQRSGVGAGGRVLELPAVGSNLIAPAAATLVFRVAAGANLHSKSVSWRNAAYLWRQWREYNDARTGVFASLAEGVAFVRSTPAAAAPDLSLTFFATPNVRWCGWRPFDGFAVRVAHHYPASRGEVAAVDADRLRVTSGIFAAPHDARCMDEGVRWVGSLVTEARSAYHSDAQERPASPFAALGVQVQHPRYALHTQRGTAAFLAQHAEGTGDLFGTCALGSVVDGALRVRGVAGLQVADASVVPSPTCGASGVIGAAIGARAASLLQL